VKKLFFLLQLGLFIAFNFFLLMTVYQLAGSSSSMERLGYNKPKYNYKEEFDPSLQRLNTVDKLVAFCDSLYEEKTYGNSKSNFAETYSDITSSVVRKRFYHGYSLYGFSNNFMAMFLSEVSMEGLSAIVIPNDILKYPYAACSQQSIVFMEILKQKGFLTRKVGFSGKNNGHFCFEVHYNYAWHFYDPDMEPDMAVLDAHNRPSIEFLARHPDILLRAYHQYPQEKILDIFPAYSYGRVNTFAAPKAIIFQQLTKFFSYTIWLFFLIAFILVRKKYLRLSRNYVRNNRIHIPRVQPGTSPVYYPNYSA
jgi:hypothetical protein